MTILLSLIACLFISIDMRAQEATIKRAGIEEVLQGTKNNLQYEIDNQWIQNIKDKASLQLECRLEFVDWNVGHFTSTCDPFADDFWSIVPPLASSLLRKRC